MYVGEAEISALESVGQFFVIEAEQVQYGGVEIVDMNGVFLHAPANLVGFADDLSAFDPAARHPNTEGIRVVIPAGHGFKS